MTTGEQREKRRDTVTMTELFSRRMQRLLIAAVLPLLAGCSLIFPLQIERKIMLDPREDMGDSYKIGTDGSVSYLLEGLRVEVKYMTDQEMNEVFTQESDLGEYSINPYTYGNYIDPGVGYVQNRFTVFRVSVYNSTFAKVELDPRKASLTTGREGEHHISYSVLKAQRRKSFEDYYRALRGPSGNDYYRYNMRMGLVRSNNYGVDEKIFRGENYDGFIVFDPLDDEVGKVRLLLKDFVLKFNVFNQPLETIDIVFEFERQVDQEVFRQREAIAVRELTRAELIASSTEVSGNIPGDATREVRTINAFATAQLNSINACFEKEYEAGSAAEGQLTVSFVILPIGSVESARVVSSTVVSQAVGDCITSRIERWRFQPSRVLEPETPGEEEEEEETTQAGPSRPSMSALSPSRVTATCSFEFLDISTD
jgi:hypothetical protein